MLTAPKRLEEILVDAGIATAQDLDRARRRMTERGGRLIANLAALGLYSDEELAIRLGRAFGVPVVDRARLSRVAAPRTPSRRSALRALTIERVLMPIGATRSPRCVEVAMFDPSDTEAIDRLRAICGGARVAVSVAPRKALLEVISQVYGREQAGVLGGIDAPMVLPENLEVIEDADGDTPADGLAARGRVSHRGGAGTAAVEISSDMAADIARLGDPEAPTPPPVLLTSRDSRFTRTLLEAVATLAQLLEERVSRRPAFGRDLARYSRLVARQLGCAPSVVNEVALAAHLYGVDRALREAAAADNGGDNGGDGSVVPDLAGALGWAAGQPDGAGPILRTLAAASAGFAERADREAPGVNDGPLGASIISAVSEYLRLAAATPDSVLDRETVNQLLRLTTAPEIIEALGRALYAERQTPIQSTIESPADQEEQDDAV